MSSFFDSNYRLCEGSGIAALSQAFNTGNDREALRILRRPPRRPLGNHFATTIHKSQGSEFDRVLMVLPPEDTILLTRELIYTGITRARQAVTVLSDEAVFSSAVKRRTERRSG